MPLVEFRMWGYKCLKCGHKWIPRQLKQTPDERPKKPKEEPRVCPRCKSAWWNVPPKEGGANQKD